MLGCVSGSRTSRVQEVVCPAAQHGRDLDRRDTVPGLGKRVSGKARISWRKPSESSKNRHRAKKTRPVRTNEQRLHHQKGKKKKTDVMSC